MNDLSSFDGSFEGKIRDTQLTPPYIYIYYLTRVKRFNESRITVRFSFPFDLCYTVLSTRKEKFIRRCETVFDDLVVYKWDPILIAFDGNIENKNCPIYISNSD